MTIQPNRERVATIDGQRVNVMNFSDLLQSVMDRANRNIGFTLATLNLDHLVKLRRDRAFRSAYKRMTFVTADGMPVVQLGRKTASSLERVAGADIVLPLCEAAARTSVRIYLFGSDAETLEMARGRLQAAFPSLIICGLEAPPQGFDYSSHAAIECGARMDASKAQLCFVCLGAPKQELFADRMASLHPAIGFICVGAALDFIAQTKKRAPDALSLAGLEWAWRLLHEPRRLGPRYAQCALLLMQLVLNDARLAAIALFRRRLANRRRSAGADYAGRERRRSLGAQ